MHVQSNGFVQLATRVYQQLPQVLEAARAPAPTPAAASTSLPQGPAACLAHLQALSSDVRVTGIGAVITSLETPVLVRLLGGFVDVRKGVALAAPLEGLVITPRGLETLVGGRPQGLQPIPLLETYDDIDAFKAALDKQLTSFYEDCRSLPARYFAPKNALAAILMRTPDEM